MFCNVFSFYWFWCVVTDSTGRLFLFMYATVYLSKNEWRVLTDYLLQHMRKQFAMFMNYLSAVQFLLWMNEVLTKREKCYFVLLIICDNENVWISWNRTYKDIFSFWRLKQFVAHFLPSALNFITTQEEKYEFQSRFFFFIVISFVKCTVE